MPGLQRCILAVVGKAQNLFGFGRQLVVLLVQVTQRGQREHGGGGAPAFARQRGQAQRVFAAGGVGGATGQTEPEAAGDEPRRQTCLCGQYAVRANRNGLWDVLFLRGLDAPLAVCAFFYPGFWVVFEVVGLPCARCIGHQVTGFDAIVLVLAFVDAANTKGASLGTVLVPHRDVLLATVTAEVDVVQAAVAVAGDKLLAVQRDGTHTGCFKCGEYLATTRDELVELEGEKGFPRSICDAVRLQQEGLQVLAALGFGQPRGLGQ